MNDLAEGLATPATRALRFPAYSVAGTSFKPDHLPAILADTSLAGFFEVHAENYMGAGGPPHAALGRSDATARCRCMASACRSAGPGRWTRRISDGLRRLSIAMSQPSFRSTSPGRATAGSTTAICCRCPTRPPHLLASPSTLANVIESRTPSCCQSSQLLGSSLNLV